MADDDTGSTSRRWARTRLCVVGGLLASPPARGQLGAEIRRLSEQQWRHPTTGEWTSFAPSTIERWLYRARDAADPIAALSRQVRSDAGRERVMSTALLEALGGQYRQHRGWSYQLHADNLEALAAEDLAKYGPAPSYTTIRRRMQARDWLPRRLPRRPTPGQRAAAEHLDRFEVRSFEATHVHGLWHWDFHEGRRRIVDASGQWHTPFLLGILDDRSRLCCHVQWYLSESSETLFHGLAQAFAKRGLPRKGMHDNGSAMRAQEIQRGLERWGIESCPTLAHSPYQNAKQETFWCPVEGRLMSLLESVSDLSLSFLNRATQAWVEREYNRTRHDELGCSPLDRLLGDPAVGRTAPTHAQLQQTFACERTRVQRRSDGTVSIEGVRFELPGRLRTLTKPIVRYQRWDLSRAWVVDDCNDTVLATIRPLDKASNADGRRRTLQPVHPDETPADQPVEEIPALLRKYLEEYAATGLPPAYLPLEETELEAPHPDNDEDERDDA